MVTLLAKIFIQEKNDQAKIREEYGVLCELYQEYEDFCKRQ